MMGEQRDGPRSQTYDYAISYKQQDTNIWTPNKTELDLYIE